MTGTGPKQLALPMFETWEYETSTESTSSPAVSRVRIFHGPETALASLVHDLVYGESLPGLLATYDPESCSWKTYLPLLIEAERPLLPTLPRWGTTRGGELWALPTPERRTSGTVGGSWPATPAASDWKRGSVSAEYAAKRHSLTLPELLTATKWPTANADDHSNRAPSRSAKLTRSGTYRHIQPNGEQSFMRLSQVVAMWSTPKASQVHPHRNAIVVNGRRVSPSGSNYGIDLSTQVLWATPTASDHQRGHRSGRFRRSTPTVMEANPNGGVLNPEWVEMLMGYPAGWTDIGSQPDPAPSIRGSRRAKRYRVVRIGSPG